MSSFFKSIYGTITSTNGTKRRQCPNYFNAIHVNNNSCPKVVEGLNVTTKTDVSRVFGARPTTAFLTNTLTLNPFRSTGVNYGLLYANNKDQTENSADQEATVQTSVNADLNGHVTGHAQCRVTDHVTVDVWDAQVDREDKSRQISATTNWSGDRLNASAALSVKTDGDDGEPLTTFSAECVRQFGDRWTIGSDLSVDTADTGDDRWRPAAVQCSGALRYDGKRNTLVAAVNRAANVSLWYRRRINDDLTVGAEVNADVRNKTAKIKLLHRAKFGDGVEIRGQIDTNGLVVGDVRKAFPQYMFNVGVSASLNYKTNQIGLGVELNVN